MNTSTRSITRSIGTVAIAAALTVSLAPSAGAQDSVPVRLKVATEPAVEVSVAPRSWPSTVVEDHPVDNNDLVEVVRNGRVVTGDAKRVRAGDTVRVVAVEKHRVTKQSKVRAEVVEVPTTKLKPGQREVVRKGRAGLAEVTLVRTFHNGEKVGKRVVDRTVITEPRTRRVLVGQQPYSVPGADGLNWAALAGCESGGNPRAVNAAGYYGLYQFNVGTWNSVGGSGMPHHASADEQTYRAKLLYKSRGRSPWPTCGRLL